MENPRHSKTNVKALTAMFAERNEPIMGVKSSPSANISKLPNSRVSVTKKSLPRGEKPPIKTQKPILPKVQPRKPPRSSIGVNNVRRSSLLSSSANESDNNNIKAISPIETVYIENNLKNQSTLESSTTSSQSHDSLNTVFTNDSGISSNPRLDTIYKTLPVNNDLYDSGSCTDVPTLSDGKCSFKIGGSESSINKENFIKDLEERIGSDPHIKSSNESLANSNNSNVSDKYLRYQRVVLSALCLSSNPPRKPMLPPDVHIALVRPIASDSPPPAPPRRLSKHLDSSPKILKCTDNFRPFPELMPRRHTSPNIEIKSPTCKYKF